MAPDENQRLANAQRGDGLAVLLVIYFLGAFALMGLIGALILTYKSLALPQSTGALLTPLFALIGSAVGGLGSLLASTRNSPLQAQVINTPDKPIPTHEEGGKSAPAILVVVPATANVAAGGSQLFSVTGATGALQWSVKDGGAGGTINADTGQYTAPASAGTDMVIATDQGDASKTAAAAVTITA